MDHFRRMRTMFKKKSRVPTPNSSLNKAARRNSLRHSQSMPFRSSSDTVHSQRSRPVYRGIQPLKTSDIHLLVDISPETIRYHEGTDQSRREHNNDGHLGNELHTQALHRTPSFLDRDMIDQFPPPPEIHAYSSPTAYSPPELPFQTLPEQQYPAPEDLLPPNPYFERLEQEKRHKPHTSISELPYAYRQPTLQRSSSTTSYSRPTPSAYPTLAATTPPSSPSSSHRSPPTTPRRTQPHPQLSPHADTIVPGYSTGSSNANHRSNEPPRSTTVPEVRARRGHVSRPLPVYDMQHGNMSTKSLGVNTSPKAGPAPHRTVPRETAQSLVNPVRPRNKSDASAPPRSEASYSYYSDSAVLHPKYANAALMEDVPRMRLMSSPSHVQQQQPQRAQLQHQPQQRTRLMSTPLHDQQQPHQRTRMISTPSGDRQQQQQQRVRLTSVPSRVHQPHPQDQHRRDHISDNEMYPKSPSIGPLESPSRAKLVSVPSPVHQKHYHVAEVGQIILAPVPSGRRRRAPSSPSPLARGQMIVGPSTGSDRQDKNRQRL